MSEVSIQRLSDAAIRNIVSENVRLDVVLHNAGHMVFGPAEAFTPKQLAGARHPSRKVGARA